MSMPGADAPHVPKVVPPVRPSRFVEGGRGLLLDRISHSYGGLNVVSDVSLDVRDGELVALLGPSGCGKTTLLRIVAGFVRQTSGHVQIGGEVVDELPPSGRRTGIVFQNYALFPHMTAGENVAYGLAAQGYPKRDRAPRVTEMLSLVQMAGFADRFPRQLSGGQQQRIALARALAVQPSVLLLDESFSALDKNLRQDMQIEVRRIQQMAGITTILVTHDQEEAMTMADRVAVLNAGNLEQVGTPLEIYDRPASLFVSTFVGTSNILPGRAVAAQGEGHAVVLDLGVRLTGRMPGAGGVPDGQPVVVSIRPEHLQIASGEEGLEGTIDLSFALGSTVVHDVRLRDGSTVKVEEARRDGARPLARGAPVRVTPTRPDDVGIFAVDETNTGRMR